ncbi:MAG: amino acid ABC transporter substrate-binding protein [Chloroflexia bacterium]|nr:amino acid ABC transporter substrate-binding protein [Chloroflexia bacterium]
MRIRQRIAIIILVSYTVLILVSEVTSYGTAVVDPVMARIHSRGQMRVGYDPGVLPFTTTQNGQAAGYDIDLTRALAQTMQVAVLYVPTSLDAAYDALQQGQIDLMASAMPYAPEQGWRARFSTFYVDDGMVIVSRGGGRTVAQLSDQPVGVVFGGDGDSALRQRRRAGQIITPVYYDRTLDLWQALVCGTVHVAVVEHTTALGMVARDPQLQIGAALSFVPYVLVMPYDAVYLQDAVNMGLAQRQQDGTMTRLAAQWFRAAAVACPTPP